MKAISINQTLKSDLHRNAIIDGAIRTFSLKGYSKTSFKDISVTAGVSKALVLYYFPNKIDLVSYLLTYATGIIHTELSSIDLNHFKDFFDRFIQVMTIKFNLIKKHPSLFAFLERMLQDEHKDIQKTIQSYKIQHQSKALDIALTNIDKKKFRPLIKSDQVFMMIQYLSKGFFHGLSITNNHHLDSLFQEFKDLLHLLKLSFYREEFI